MTQDMYWSKARTVVGVLALLSLVACGRTNPGGATSSNAAPEAAARRGDALERMLRDKKITVGYAGYAPFLRRDANTGAISGYSVDLLTNIVEPLGVNVVWKETTWDNMKQDLLLNKFDLMVEPIFYTLPRAAQVAFTRPYAYFGYAVPVVRKGETRFRSMQDLNVPTVTIAVTQGVTDQEYVSRNLPRAKMKLIPGNDISITLTEVLAGKVDAALADVPTVLQFLKAHPKEVQALFLDSPPATTPAGFMIRQDDLALLNFLNTALVTLEAQGIFDQLESRYALPSFREKHTWVIGHGLEH